MKSSFMRPPSDTEIDVLFNSIKQIQKNEVIKEWLGPLPNRDRQLGNTNARSGLVRCACGCKYWEDDRCIDCDYVLHLEDMVPSEWGGYNVGKEQRKARLKAQFEELLRTWEQEKNEM